MIWFTHVYSQIRRQFDPYDSAARGEEGDCAGNNPTTLLLLGFADWMSVFLYHKFKSSKVIALLIDLVGL